MAKSKALLLLQSVELRKGSVIGADEVAALQRRWRPYGPMVGTRFEEYEQLNTAMPFQVDLTATVAGLAWWRKMCFRKDGKTRATTFTEENCSPTVVHVLNNFDHFELVDFTWLSQCERPFPVYEAVAKDGERFEFVQRSGQSGGNYILGTS